MNGEHHHKLQEEIKLKEREILAQRAHIQEYLGEIEEKNDLLQHLHNTVQTSEAQVLEVNQVFN